MKNKDSTETLPPLEDFKALLSKALTRESDPSKVRRSENNIRKNINRKSFSQFCIGFDRFLD